MKRIEDIKEFKDIDTYYEISEIVEEVFQDRAEVHKHLITANKEIERLNNIINEINSIVEYWGYDKEHNDISSFRMAMKNIKDILGSDK